MRIFLAAVALTPPASSSWLRSVLGGSAGGVATSTLDHASKVGSAATSGREFRDAKFRSYPESNLRFRAWRPSPPASAAVRSGEAPGSWGRVDSAWCQHWAVVTTISEPSEGVRRASWLAGWCTVVVADRKGPISWEPWLANGTFLNRQTTKYLTVAEQEQIARDSSFVAMLPWSARRLTCSSHTHATLRPRPRDVP